MGSSVDLDNSNGGAGTGGGAAGSTPFTQTINASATNNLDVGTIDTSNIISIEVWTALNVQTPLTNYNIVDANTINIPSAGVITNARIEVMTRS